MAIVLDINFLCNKMVDKDIIEQLLSEYQVSIKSVNSINNWMWDNEKKVDLQQLEKILNNNQIAIIELKQMLIKDLGVYIEKIEDFYHYTLWINIEGYSILDCDRVNVKNRKFFEKVIQTIIRMNGRVENFFEVVGIGLETDIYYSKNIIDIIRNSKNIMIWILNRYIELNNEVADYKVKDVEGVKVLEKEEKI